MSTLRHYDTVQRLRSVISALAPTKDDIVSVPTFGVSATCVIKFAVTATQPQKDAANAALASFDWSDEALFAWVDAGIGANYADLRAQASAAITTNNTFLAIVGNPTTQQLIDQAQALTRQSTKVIQTLRDAVTQLTGR